MIILITIREALKRMPKPSVHRIVQVSTHLTKPIRRITAQGIVLKSVIVTLKTALEVVLPTMQILQSIQILQTRQFLQIVQAKAHPLMGILTVKTAAAAVVTIELLHHKTQKAHQAVICFLKMALKTVIALKTLAPAL